MALLEIHELQVTYPNRTAPLKSINLSARAGEIIAIVGREDVGKSTLLRCINGLQKASAGKIILDYDEITAKSRAELRHLRRRIGFIWQEPNLMDRLSAFTNVLSGRLGYNHSTRDLMGYFDQSHRYLAVHNLQRVKLMHRARQRADQLADWEKKQVAIARAMAQEPKILLVDDPIANLNLEHAWQVMSTLVQVAREDEVLTLIAMRHIEFAKQFADRLIALADGYVVYDGHPQFLTDDLIHRIYNSAPNQPTLLPKLNPFTLFPNARQLQNSKLVE
jgi:phosphonate transport system ATP-binding protein